MLEGSFPHHHSQFEVCMQIFSFSLSPLLSKAIRSTTKLALNLISRKGGLKTVILIFTWVKSLSNNSSAVKKILENLRPRSFLVTLKSIPFHLHAKCSWEKGTIKLRSEPIFYRDLWTWTPINSKGTTTPAKHQSLAAEEKKEIATHTPFAHAKKSDQENRGTRKKVCIEPPTPLWPLLQLKRKVMPTKQPKWQQWFFFSSSAL